MLSRYTANFPSISTSPAAALTGGGNVIAFKKESRHRCVTLEKKECSSLLLEGRYDVPCIFKISSSLEGR